MNSLSSYPTKESIFMDLVNLSSATRKDDFSHIGGMCGELPNQIRETVGREIIRLFAVKI